MRMKCGGISGDNVESFPKIQRLYLNILHNILVDSVTSILSLTSLVP